MQQPVSRIILLPRYTAFAGATTFTGAPIWVRPYAQLILSLWRGSGLGSDAALQLQLHQSPDLESWSTLGSPIAPSANQETTQPFSLGADWIKFRVDVTGSDPGITSWAVADLVPRHS